MLPSCGVGIIGKMPIRLGKRRGTTEKQQIFQHHMSANKDQVLFSTRETKNNNKKKDNIKDDE